MSEQEAKPRTKARNINEAEPGTVIRIGAAPTSVTLDDGQVVVVRRAKGKRFRIVMTTSKPIKGKGRVK